MGIATTISLEFADFYDDLNSFKGRVENLKVRIQHTKLKLEEGMDDKCNQQDERETSSLEIFYLGYLQNDEENFEDYVQKRG